MKLELGLLVTARQLASQTEESAVDKMVQEYLSASKVCDWSKRDRFEDALRKFVESKKALNGSHPAWSK